MASPSRRGVAVRPLLIGLWAMLLAAGAGVGQTITVTTNQDLWDAQSLGFGKSLRDAITEANAVGGTGAVVIDFDPTVFVPNGAGAANTIVVGDPANQGYVSNFPWAITPPPTGVLPLPTITRSNVRIDADRNDDGVQDVTLDFTNVAATFPTMFAMVRSWGLRISAPTGVVLEGLRITGGQVNTLTQEDSVPAVQILSGTSHSVRGCSFSGNVIGIETNCAAGSQYLIGSVTSSGYANRFTGNTFTGLYIRHGGGTVVVQNDTFTGNGNASKPFSGGIVIESTNNGNNLIGGTVNLAANTISSNLNGVVIRGSGQNTVQQCTIASNTQNGIRISGSGDNRIGGSTALAGNSVTGNGPGGSGYNHAGIYIDGNGNGDNTIQGNDLTDNGGAGVQIDGDGANLVGGTAAGAANNISNNGTLGSAESRAGVAIQGDNLNDGSPTIENNTIRGNLHGVTVAGNGTVTIGGSQTASLNHIINNTYNGIRLSHNGTTFIRGNDLTENGVHGIEISDNINSVNNIGGTAASERNIISGNGTDGIAINGGGQNLIYGNHLGVNAAGTGDQGNGRNGITISTNAAGSNVIGGAAPGQRNVISGNGGFGIAIQGTPATGSNTIKGNYLGISAPGTTAIGNTTGGIIVEGGASNQTIGGSAQGDGNIIAGNGSSNPDADGIELGGPGNNTVMGNVIGAVPANPAGFPIDARLTAEGQHRNGGAGIFIGSDSTGAIQIGNTGEFENNVIVNNGRHGIDASGSGVLTCYHNLIGAALDQTSTFVAMPNQGDGILIAGSGNNVIGAVEETPDDPNTSFWNVIAGNAGNGVNIVGPGQNTLVANHLGTDSAGTAVAGNQANGVVITGTGDNTLRHNQVAGNTLAGVNLFAPGTTTLVGNRIGRTAATEPAGFANGTYGVYIPDQASGQLVLGGGAATDANTISGNTLDGVRIEGNRTNDLLGNQIGTDTAGAVGVGNGQSGVYLQGAQTTVTTLSGNTISGNGQYGVHVISGSNTIRRNRIGTDKAGLVPVANTSHGVYLNDPNLPTVRRGVVIGERSIANVDNGNVISGNGGDGIHIVQAGGDVAGNEADDILIRNNRIGLDIGGNNAVANNGNGVRVLSSCTGKVQLGGPAEGDGNLISSNGAWGVWFEGVFTYNPGLGTDNTPVIFRNLVGTNVQGELARANGLGGLLVDVPAGSLPAQPRIVPIGGVRPTGGGFPFSNLIAGNNGPGLVVQNTAWYEIYGNQIGTDSFSREVLPNTGSGIRIEASSTGGIFIGSPNDQTIADPGFTPPVSTLTDPTRLNIISGNGGYGVESVGTGFVGVGGNFIGSREVVGSPGLAEAFPSGGGNASGGVYLAGGQATANADVMGNMVYRNGPSGGVGSGLTLATASQVDVQGNGFYYGNGDGVTLNGAGAYHIHANTIAQQTRFGVLVLDATNPTIGSAALTATTDNDGNLIVDNGNDGLATRGGSGLLLSDNMIRGNGVVSGTYNGSLGIDLGDDGTSDNPNLKLDRLLKNGDNTWTVTGTMPTTTRMLEIYQADDPALLSPDSNISTHRGQTLQFLTRLTEANDLDTAANNFDAAAGRFAFTVPAGVMVGTDANVLLTLLATDTGNQTTEFSRNTGMVNVPASEVAVNPGSIPADGSAAAQATATVTVKDVIGTPLPGVPNVLVTCTPAADGTKIVLTQSASTTDLNGQVTATIRATERPECGGANPAANQLTIGGTIDAAVVPQTQSLVLTLGPPLGGRSSLVGPGTSVIADGTSLATLTLTLRDGGGTAGCAVPGVDASRLAIFQVVGGAPAPTMAPELTLTGPTQATDGLGQTSAQVTSTKTGTYTFGFSIDGVNATNGGTLVTADVTFGSGAVDAAGSSFVADPATVLANGSSQATLTLTARDAQGNAVPDLPAANIQVTAAPSAGVILTGPTAPTDAQGQTTLTVVSSTPGQVSFTAVVNGTTLAQQAQVTFTVGAPSGNSSLVASTTPASNPVQARPNGTDQVLLTATMRDAVGNPTPGIEVTITATTGTGITVVGPSAPTDANGQTTATATATQVNFSPPAVFTATALVNGVPTPVGTAQVLFRMLDPDAAQSTLTVTTDTPLLANGQRQATVTVRLVDPLGDPLQGVRPDEFAITQVDPALGGLVVSGPADATDANGEARFTMTSTTAGTATVQVAVRGVTLAQTAQAVFVPSMTQSYGPGLHMIGVAGRPVRPDPRDVLANLLPNLDLAQFDAGNQQYRVWEAFSPADPADPYNLAKNPFAMVAGRGFWLQVPSLTSFTTVGDPTPAAPFTMNLARGWNQLANPFTAAWPFRLDRITVLQNGTAVGTLASAAGRQLVEPYAWRWDPVLQYLLLMDPTTSTAANLVGELGVGRGFWWLCRGDNVAVVLEPPTAAARADRSRAATPSQWLATLEAAAAEGRSQVFIGAGSSRLRAAAPPEAPVAQPVTMRLVDATGRAAGDVRPGPLTTRQVWQVEVTSLAAGDVTLSWAGLSRALPAQHKLYLVDPTAGRRVLLNSSAAYRYAAAAGTRPFRLELDPRGERNLNIVDLTVAAGRSRSRGVPVVLTLTGPADVTLTVRGVGGKLIRQTTLPGSEGVNNLVWDGRDATGRPVPAGTYVLEVTARSDEGELARAVRTVTVR